MSRPCTRCAGMGSFPLPDSEQSYKRRERTCTHCNGTCQEPETTEIKEKIKELESRIKELEK